MYDRALINIKFTIISESLSNYYRKMGGERDIWGQDPKIFQVFLLKDSLRDTGFLLMACYSLI